MAILVSQLPTEQTKTLSICIDLETLSMKPNAQIINIGAVAFSHDGSIDIDPNWIDNREDLYINPISSIHINFDIDMDTVNWWRNKNGDIARSMSFRVVEKGQSLFDAITDLCHFIEDVKINYSDEKTKLLFWSQGKDFDFPILEHAMTECGFDIPWKHTQLRCARDYVMNGAELMGWCDSPYEHLPKFEVDGVAHTALYDACRSAHNVTEMYKLLKSRFIDKPAPKE